MKMFTFEIAGSLMGLEARHVYRVLEGVSVTPVCFTPSAYMGLIYYRGELFDAVDVARLLERPDESAPGEERFIVVRWSSRKMALFVRAISGLLWIESEQGKETCCTEDGRAVEVLLPERLWDKLRSLPYGPVQV